MDSYGESSRHLHDEPVSPLQLATHVMYDVEKVPNARRMRIVEEEVSLSQSKTIAVPPEEEEVPVPQGLSITVSPEEEVPPEEEEFPAPAVVVSPEEEEVLAALLLTDLPEGRGCLVPIPTMVSSSPFFFFSKMQEILLAFFLINMVDL
jgi:hypothetical protein